MRAEERFSSSSALVVVDGSWDGGGEGCGVAMDAQASAGAETTGDASILERVERGGGRGGGS